MHKLFDFRIIYNRAVISLIHLFRLYGTVRVGSSLDRSARIFGRKIIKNPKLELCVHFSFGLAMRQKFNSFFVTASSKLKKKLPIALSDLSSRLGVDDEQKKKLDRL